MTQSRRPRVRAMAVAAAAVTATLVVAPAAGASPSDPAAPAGPAAPLAAPPLSAAAAAAAKAAWGRSTVADLAATALSQQAEIEAWRDDPARAWAFAETDPELGRLVDAYNVTRSRLADEVAVAGGVDPGQLFAAWSRTSEARRTVVYTALSQVGVPYRRNTSSPGRGFDCSGLTKYAWGTIGVDLPHHDQRQMNQSSARSWETAEPGDLVQYPGHVSMFLGAGRAIVHAPYTGRNVEIRTMERTVRLGSPAG